MTIVDSHKWSMTRFLKCISLRKLVVLLEYFIHYKKNKTSTPIPSYLYDSFIGFKFLNLSSSRLPRLGTSSRELVEWDICTSDWFQNKYL